MKFILFKMYSMDFSMKPFFYYPHDYIQGLIKLNQSLETGSRLGINIFLLFNLILLQMNKIVIIINTKSEDIQKSFLQ